MLMTADVLRALLADFGLWLRANKGYKQTTVDTYLPRIVAFFVWRASQGRPSALASVTQQDVDDYLRARATGRIATRLGLSHDRSSTLAGRICAIRAFMRYLVYTGRLQADPSALVPTPRRPELLPSVFTASELRRLFRATKPQPTDLPSVVRRKLRDRAIMMTLYGTGLRRHELTGLRVEDIQDDGPVMHITVLGKGAKQRTVPMRGIPVRNLRQWLHERAALKPQSTEVFVRIKGAPVGMTGQNVHRMLKSYARLISSTLEVKTFTHKFRSTWATSLHEAGAPDRVICALAGWDSSETIARYVAVSEKSKSRAVIPHSTWQRLLKEEAGDEEV